MMYKVLISRRAEKDLKKVPLYIKGIFYEWISAVRLNGLENVRLIKGYHDEPLRGRRKGQRSIRLSRSYRAIYILLNDEVAFCEVKEVNKHGY